MNISIDGYNIKYKITGNGENTIVMLQGWGTTLEVYDMIANILNTQYRFVQFDFPGFGGSDEPKEAWNVDDFADFFCKFMEKLEIKEATLIGHSFGGRVIIKLAARKMLPFVIERIVLIDSAGILPQKTFAQKVKIRKYKILMKLLLNKVVEALLPATVEDWRSRQGSADYRNASPIMRQCLVRAVNEDLEGLLPSIKQDTLLVWGDQDTATPIRDANIMKEKITNSGLVVLEGAGHFSFLEKQSLFTNVMRTYFRIGVNEQ